MGINKAVTSERDEIMSKLKKLYRERAAIYGCASRDEAHVMKSEVQRDIDFWNSKLFLIDEKKGNKIYARADVVVDFGEGPKNVTVTVQDCCEELGNNGHYAVSKDSELGKAVIKAPLGGVYIYNEKVAVRVTKRY